MKLNIIFLLTLCFCLFDVPAKQPSEIIKIEFTTSTRGYQKQVLLTKKIITVQEEDRQSESKTPITKKMKAKDWNRLMQSVKNIPLAELPLLKSPTSHRASDGAKASSISITTSDGVIWSHEFDNENPHEKLQPLMNVIHTLTATN